MTEITISKAVKKCKDFQDKTGKVWYFKANKGVIKLVCDLNNNQNE